METKMKPVAKVCGNCKIRKFIRFFYKDKNGELRDTCKVCMSKENKHIKKDASRKSSNILDSLRKAAIGYGPDGKKL